MKISMYFVLVFLMLFIGCEDKKKASPTKNEKAPDIENIPIEDKTLSEGKKDSTSNKYPKITEENLVPFLTEYGKENPETEILISTNHGDIKIELFTDTPLHRANFVYLVKQGYFNDTYFHRVVPDFIIQGGSSDNASTSHNRTILGKDYLLPAEITRNHGYGTVSGAKEYRENPNKKSAPFEFFIFLGPQSSTSHLNGNYTVFGKVTQGMEVVEKIAIEKADAGEWPLQNVYIKAEVVR